MDGANLVLFKSEFYILQNKDIKNQIVDFYRFIDDGSLILRIAFEDIKSFLEEFASYYPKDLEIEFKVSKFQTNFLDLSFGIGYNTYTERKCYYRVYQNHLTPTLTQNSLLTIHLVFLKVLLLLNATDIGVLAV